MKKDTVRTRLSIPSSDKAVIKWLEKQSSVSASIRLLIRTAISQYGNCDIIEKVHLGDSLDVNIREVEEKIEQPEVKSEKVEVKEEKIQVRQETENTNVLDAINSML
ncbi:hypothetical protein [Filifactor alocis]|uniref:hypothetical protein n=1 Tax=Filifactor alocis TaxID=143361 RepID=UPI003FA04F12